MAATLLTCVHVGEIPPTSSKSPKHQVELGPSIEPRRVGDLPTADGQNPNTSEGEREGMASALVKTQDDFRWDLVTDSEDESPKDVRPGLPERGSVD